MKIKWAKEFSCGKAVKRGSCNGLLKQMLAKKDVCSNKSYKISDLYCGELSVVEYKEVNSYVEDGTSDISFYLKPLKIGIFTYSRPEFYKYAFVGGDYYACIVSGKKFVSDNYQANIRIKIRDIIINSRTVDKLIDRYYKDVLEIGYTENSVLTELEVEQLEKMLNEKYKHFLYCSHYVR